jgi:hypothetical protein
METKREGVIILIGRTSSGGVMSGKTFCRLEVNTGRKPFLTSNASHEKGGEFRDKPGWRV